MIFVVGAPLKVFSPLLRSLDLFLLRLLLAAAVSLFLFSLSLSTKRIPTPSY